MRKTMPVLCCPFCEGVSISISDYENIVQVECSDCGARGPVEMSEDDTRKERHQGAIAGWNSASASKTHALTWELPEN